MFDNGDNIIPSVVPEGYRELGWREYELSRLIHFCRFANIMPTSLFQTI